MISVILITLSIVHIDDKLPTNVIDVSVCQNGGSNVLIACIETCARYQLNKDFYGFADYTAKLEGGHWYEKAVDQFKEFNRESRSNIIQNKNFFTMVDLVKNGIPVTMLDDGGDDTEFGTKVSSSIVIASFYCGKYLVINPIFPECVDGINVRHRWVTEKEIKDRFGGSFIYISKTKVNFAP